MTLTSSALFRRTFRTIDKELDSPVTLFNFSCRQKIDRIETFFFDLANQSHRLHKKKIRKNKLPCPAPCPSLRRCDLDIGRHWVGWMMLLHEGIAIDVIPEVSELRIW